MDCEKAMNLLDAYVDGELTPSEMQMMEEHAKICKHCEDEIKAAIFLKETLAHMDDDVAIPLEAQAAWRKQIRLEAGKKRRSMWLRGTCAVAAAFVLVMSVHFAFDKPEDAQSLSLDEQQTVASSELVARDGSTRMIAEATEYAVWKKIDVDSVEVAIQAVNMLTEEYNGNCNTEEDGICRVEIPSAYLDDFVKACSHLGTETYCESSECDSEIAVILFQFNEKLNQ